MCRGGIRPGCVHVFEIGCFETKKALQRIAYTEKDGRCYNGSWQWSLFAYTECKGLEYRDAKVFLEIRELGNDI
ncbi:hypothetical protein GCM10008915_40610 [Bifidobacterium pullorum subsp. gallinarum]